MRGIALSFLACLGALACEQAAGNTGPAVDEPPLHEPPGFVRLSDQPWNDVFIPKSEVFEYARRKVERVRGVLFGQPDSAAHWNYLRRAGKKDVSIVTDPSAPHSPGRVLRIPYTAGCCIDAEPSVSWIDLPTVREVYTAWWMKLSPNWIPNPAGGGKITFLWTTPQGEGLGQGQVYTNLYHQGGDENGWVTGPPYRVGANTEWLPYKTKIWLPNVTATGINPDEWHRIEFYYKWGTADDGIIRWWVDGVLNGDYTNVSYPGATGFHQFEFAPTVQFAGPEDRYMDIDHTVVSLPAATTPP